MTTGEAGKVPLRAKKAHEPQPEIAIVVTVRDDGNVELDGDDLHLSLWHHDPTWLQSVLDQAGHHGLWKPRFHALFAPRYGGRIFNLAALDHLTPCVADDDHSPAYTAETALERAAPGPLLAGSVGANSSVAHLLLTLLLGVVGCQRHQVVVDRCASRETALQYGRQVGH